LKFNFVYLAAAVITIATRIS